MLKAATQFQSELEALFEPRSVFLATTLRQVKGDDATMYEVLDPDCAHMLIKGVPGGTILTAVLGLDKAAKDPYKLEGLLTEDGHINEALLRDNAPSEAAFQKTLDQVKDRVALNAYHDERIAARAAWAKETRVSITYDEYHGLRQLVMKAQLEREDLVVLAERLVAAGQKTLTALKEAHE